MRKVITLLWVSVAALVAFGLVLVSSSSAALKGGAFPFMRTQTVATLVGLSFAVLLSRVDYRIWQNKYVVISLAVFSIALASLVFLFPPINGSRRWVNFAGLSLQPSEFSRIGMIIVLSAWFGKIGYYKTRTFLKGFLYPILILVFMMAPVALSPDLGASIVIAISCGTIFLAAGVRLPYVILSLLAFGVLAGAFLMSSPNRRARVETYIESMRGNSSGKDTDYHSEQAQEAFIRGGLTGAGIGRSFQKHKYLPEANTDFIYSIAGEEFGLIGTVLIVVLFAVLLCCGVYISYHAYDRFGMLLSLGLTVLITFEAAFNVGMVTGILPTKGLALPFISYGGTSMMASFMAFGLLVEVGCTSANKEMTPAMRDACNDFN